MNKPDPPINPLLLVEPLLLGELADAQVAALERWLAEDESHRVSFLDEVALCRGIRRAVLASDSSQALDDDSWDEDDLELVAEGGEPDVMGEVIDLALAERRRHEVEERARRMLLAEQAKLAAVRRPVHSQSQARHSFVIPLSLVGAGLAAALFLAVVLLWPTVPTPQGPGTTAVPPTEPSVGDAAGPEVPAAQVVARLEQAHRPRWTSSAGGAAAARPDADGRMPAGRYALASGAIELRMGRGVVLLIEGPAEFDLLDDHTVYLGSGRLSADARAARAGFHIDTPTATLRDHGATFGLLVDPAGRTHAHVYAGRLDLASLNNTAPAGTVSLAARDSASVNSPAAAPTREPVAPEQFALDMAALTGKPVVTGQADYYRQMPHAVMLNLGHESPRAWVALESTGRLLRSGTASAKRFPERPRVFNDARGRVVDSYIVVLDPTNNDDSLKTADFEVVFPGEVLTVICETADMIDSHAWYGNESTRYDMDIRAVAGLEGERGAGDPPTFSPDTVELLPDGRTIRVHLGVYRGIDLFRVLVVSPTSTGVGPQTRASSIVQAASPPTPAFCPTTPRHTPPPAFRPRVATDTRSLFGAHVVGRWFFHMSNYGGQS